MSAKPKPYRKGKYKVARTYPSLRVGREFLPKAVYIHCEEMGAKDCLKFAAWLRSAAKWLK